MIFDKVSANPTKSVVEEGGKFARENGCDFVVALSGEDSQLIYTRADIEFIFYGACEKKSVNSQGSILLW